MARQSYYDDQGREYRYDHKVDATPRRKIMGYSAERQGGRDEARQRAADRTKAARERSDAGMKRGFSGLPAAPVAPVPQAPTTLRPPPPLIRRPAEQVPAQPTPLRPAVQTAELAAPRSSYMTGLQETLNRLRATGRL